MILQRWEAYRKFTKDKIAEYDFIKMKNTFSKNNVKRIKTLEENVCNAPIS